MTDKEQARFWKLMYEAKCAGYNELERVVKNVIESYEWEYKSAGDTKDGGSFEAMKTSSL